MKEIEALSEDNSKLQQMLEIASALRSPHQMLEEFIRDSQINIQRQLTERQASDAQLNVLELNLNAQWVESLNSSENVLKLFRF